MRWLMLALALVGCAHTVPVDVAPTPAAPTHATAFRVVAAERSCRSVADAVALQLRRTPGLAVDPRGDYRLDVFGCGESWQSAPPVEDMSDDGSRSQAPLTGRAYAAAALSISGHFQANLIGTSRGGANDRWSVSSGITSRGLQRRAQRSFPHQVAADLLQQLDPRHRSVQRRVYAHAPSGTRRELHNLAVAAERWGDLDTAYFLAAAAHDAKPTVRSAGYVADLARRRLLHLPFAAAAPSSD